MKRSCIWTALVLATSWPPQASAASEAPPPIRQAALNGVTLSYQVTGPDKGRPILLIAGTGMQLVEWPSELIDRLVRAGFKVITFDNRDAGASTHFTQAGSPDWAKVFAALQAGKAAPLPYTANDMAEDVLGLMDRLGLARADLMGVSGGATIAELVAIARPDRVRSLSLIAATSGNPAIPIPADPKRLSAIPQPSAGEGREAVFARRLAGYRSLAGKSSGFDERTVRPLLESTVVRDSDPFGFARQGAALVVLGDLRTRLATIKAPTVVVHGGDDPLISPRLGREVADAIPGARFMSIQGMGHELPASHAADIAAAVKANADRAR